MDLLVLGGGGFLGHHVVAEALAAGHAVTTFSRPGSDGLPGAERLEGDRNGDLSTLEGARTWDAVLDTFSGPAAVAATAALLAGRVGAYGYVSGMSVYAPDGPAVPDEEAPVRRSGAWAGDPLQERSEAKLACEAAARVAFDGSVLVVRPGIMVGPRDPSDRFTSWPVRMAAATGPMAAPGDPTRPVQYTDARDLAAWVVRMLAAGEGGLYNGVGPGREDTVGAVLAACAEAAGVSPELVWVAEDHAAAVLAGVEEEARPLWFPEPQIRQRAIDSSRALAAGLTFRPALETARDTLASWREHPREAGLRASLTPAIERALLAG